MWRREQEEPGEFLLWPIREQLIKLFPVRSEFCHVCQLFFHFSRLSVSGLSALHPTKFLPFLNMCAFYSCAIKTTIYCTLTKYTPPWLKATSVLACMLKAIVVLRRHPQRDVKSVRRSWLHFWTRVPICGLFLVHDEYAAFSHTSVRAHTPIFVLNTYFVRMLSMLFSTEAQDFEPALWGREEVSIMSSQQINFN